jgi:CO/xanthine dehydrogenase Mo-binding subunit
LAAPPTPRIDAADKVAGRTVYAADVTLPGICHAAVARSPHPHAGIVSVDTAAARSMPGVIGVFRGTDFPERFYGRRVLDVPPLAREETRFIGERVVAVVAETREQAERAAARVEVEYEILPAALDAGSALDPGSPAVHSTPWTYGGAVAPEGSHNLQARAVHGSEEAADAALAASAHTVDAVYTTPTGHQGYIEPQACVAQVEAGGGIHVWIASKSPFTLRGQLARCFDIAPDRIEIHPVAVGGDFGGKGSPMDAPLCIELAMATGRPIRMVQRYSEDLVAANPRHPARVRIRLGCDADGNLLGLYADAVLDGGAYAGFKPIVTVVPHGIEEPGQCYRIGSVFTDSRVAYTHTVPRGHMRAPGAPQAVFAFESALDELAAVARIDPIEIRRRNLIRTGEPNAFGVMRAEERGLETLDAALAAYRELPVPAGMVHGRGIAIYDRGTPNGATSLRLHPTEEGGILVEVPFPEQGSGVHTVVREGLSRHLGVSPEKILIRQVSTAELPQDDGVGGSRVTASLSRALAVAAEAWRSRTGVGPVEIKTEREELTPVTSYCVQIAQVAVDPETGQVRVLELLSACDVADIINPRAHQNQLDGAAAMGYGFAMLEDLLVADGQVWAASMGEFRMPSAQDVPAHRTVIVPGAKGVGSLNVKMAGELTNATPGAAIANAVAAAIGVRIRDIPITAERVFAGSRQQVPA